jgi:YVTN family beta-propeller protein
LNAEEEEDLMTAIAYIANSVSNTISVINTGTGEAAPPPAVVATVNVGNSPSGVAVASDGVYIYVTNSGDGTVSVIDAKSTEVVKVLPVGSNPVGVAVTPDATKAYVANNGDDTVSVIDASSLSIVSVVQNVVSPTGIVITPDGSYAYVTTQQTVTVIDVLKNVVVAIVDGLGFEPQGIAVTPIKDIPPYTIYVANFGDTTVSVIDVTSNKVVATLDGFVSPQGVAATPDGNYIYVTNTGNGPSGTVSVIATATRSVVANIPIGGSPRGVSVTADNSQACVTALPSDIAEEPGLVYIIDTPLSGDENKIVGVVYVGDGPYSLGQFTQPGWSAANVPAPPPGGRSGAFPSGGGGGGANPPIPPPKGPIKIQ